MLVIVSLLLSAIIGAVTDDLGLPIWLLFILAAGAATFLFLKGGQAERLTSLNRSRRRWRREAAGYILLNFLYLSLAGTAAYVLIARSGAVSFH
ncbi:hypothetical protein [Sphingopyxis macrogoltabida]|uniref:Uncharacterized protein n=1 Tax=Sphingopyxis macrogoltabida TaxID=33050 RepID=A0AAC8Z0G5_SPHMC|nr:hypothetical protein [Sphingopyxis macrogoltabida]ALJ12915.1 hypothetical protein LH19_08525 [Sphingopyxis macrogoltabida]AMU89618.1 hypothetical protein ATM17_11315 [Sphingopyxis macrogoltabida]